MIYNLDKSMLFFWGGERGVFTYRIQRVYLMSCSPSISVSEGEKRSVHMMSRGCCQKGNCHDLKEKKIIGETCFQHTAVPCKSSAASWTFQLFCHIVTTNSNVCYYVFDWWISTKQCIIETWKKNYAWLSTWCVRPHYLGYLQVK